MLQSKKVSSILNLTIVLKYNHTHVFVFSSNIQHRRKCRTKEKANEGWMVLC